jgi:hypothetical protein
MAAPMRGQQRSPQVGLFLDTTLGRNLLNSFLAEPYWALLESQLGSDLATQLMPSSLRSIAEKDVLALRQHEAAGIARVELRAVIGDQPIYADLWAAFREVILETDFVRLVSDNRRIGVLAFSTAWLQVVHTRDAELRTKLTDDLVEICGALARTDRAADRSEDDESRDLAWSIFEAALNLAIGAHGVPRGRRGGVRADFNERLRRMACGQRRLGTWLDTALSGSPTEYHERTLAVDRPVTRGDRLSR